MARRKFALLKDLLEYIGVDEGRVNFSWVSAAEGGRFAELVKDVTAKVKEIGPNKGIAERGHTSCEGMSPTSAKGLNESESGCCGCKQ